MNPNTDEARRLASKLRSVIPPKNHEASRILDSTAFTLRLLAADVNKLEAELAETKEGWRLSIEQHRINVMPETESAVHIAELEAENEALRAALESIALSNLLVKQTALVAGHVVEIARAALEREKP